MTLARPAYANVARLSRVRELLCSSRCRITHLATVVGFASDAVFRWAFEPRFGLSPLNDRQRFGELRP